jgi:hypothetical protein
VPSISHDVHLASNVACFKIASMFFSAVYTAPGQHAREMDFIYIKAIIPWPSSRIMLDVDIPGRQGR